MITTLDVENTITVRDGKKHLDPFEKGNTLVMVGIKHLDQESQVYTFDHSEMHVDVDKYRHNVQDALNKTTLLVGHNISHDLLWLWECGFKYTGKVFDTMLGEYILLRGITNPLDLGSVAMRHNSPVQKQDVIKDYLKRGISVRDIPHATLSEYLCHDLGATEWVYKSIQNKLQQPEYAGLVGTMDLTNEVTVVLARMYQAGFKVDMEALEQVRHQFITEKSEIEKYLNDQVHKLMGDTPINLNSPEQLSWVVYSRKPLDKSRWVSAITPYMSDADFKVAVKQNFATLYKTKAIQCGECSGVGSIYKVKKDGSAFKRATKCNACNGSGFIYEQTKDVAGLKFTAPNSKWASANGFGTSKDNLEILERVAVSKQMHEASEFLSKLRRLSALDSYLSNFVDGIAAFVKPDGLLHVRLNQHIAATGRLAGANPNMMNMPRGKTFPIKKVFISRWGGGKISEWDFAQLEFRVAGILSQDEQIKKEVQEGFDVHSYTAKVITEAGQTTTRQDAKAHTFAPLYGATGYGRTPAEAAYYEHFVEKYKGIATWHKSLARQVLSYGYIKVPSGREFSFPDVKRKRDGTITHFTQIKNYPVQSFATADIVPAVLVDIHNRLKYLQSCIVNSVHDSIVIDIHPEEIDAVKSIMDDVNKNLNSFICKRFSIDTDIPIVMEGSIGSSWLEQEDWS
jgi:DNA polymerase I-like protein with 3'-5' exonuclease and polymerase domains